MEKPFETVALAQQGVWKNSSYLVAELNTWPADRLDKLVCVWQLSRILRGGLYYDIDSTCGPLISSLTLSSHCQDIINDDVGLKQADKFDVNIAALIVLFHHDILIDLDALDLSMLESAISESLKQNIIRLPSRFGRGLYDQFYRLFRNQRQNYLSSIDTSRLVADSQNGVYQVGRYLAGPLGLFRTDVFRMAPPSADVPLWHCDDVGCNQIHHVRLTDEQPSIHRVADLLRQAADSKLGASSQWDVALYHLTTSESTVKYGDLLSFIQDSFDEDEIRQLALDLASRSNNSRFNTLVAGHLRKKGAPQGQFDVH